MGWMSRVTGSREGRGCLLGAGPLAWAFPRAAVSRDCSCCAAGIPEGAQVPRGGELAGGRGAGERGRQERSRGAGRSQHPLPAGVTQHRRVLLDNE